MSAARQRSRTPRASPMTLLPPALLGTLSVLALLVLVELLLRVGALNVYVLPLPSEVVASFGRLVAEEELLHRVLVTGTEALAAGVLVAVVGVGLGVLLHRVALLRLAVESWVAAAAAAPVVLAYPLFLVIFGRSAATIVAMGFAAGLAPMVLKTLEGLSGVRPTLVNVGRSYGLTPRQIFWKIQFPAAAPTIFVGLRLGLIFALINLVGVEFLINFGGLGQLVNDLAERYDLPGTYAAIVFVVLVSVVLFVALEAVERRLRSDAAR